MGHFAVNHVRLVAVLAEVLLFYHDGALALSATYAAKLARKGYRVCTASPCSPNGSELLLDALQALSTDETTIKGDYCLGGCCSGTVVKPYGITNARRRTLPIISDEEKALEIAENMLLEVDGIDMSKWNEIRSKIEAGERVFENSSKPDICRSCGVGLQLYRGNCAKCGKNPY